MHRGAPGGSERAPVRHGRGGLNLARLNLMASPHEAREPHPRTHP